MLQMNKEVTAQAVTAMSEPPAATGLFLVFASEKYYPQGGFNDFLCGTVVGGSPPGDP